MANVSRIQGFKPVFHTTGAPYNGQANWYYHAAGDATALFKGDFVSIAGDSQNGIATVIASTASTAILGAVVGFAPLNTDPIAGSLQGGSLVLDTPTYGKASTGYYLLVSDAPDLVYEAEAVTSAGAAYTYASGDIGSNTSPYVAGSGSTTTGNSAQAVNMTAVNTTATLTLKLIGASTRVDNETISGTSTAVKVLVTPNVAVFGHGTGAVGV